MTSLSRTILSSAAFAALSLAAVPEGAAQSLDFGADIWPIFESRCIECHGPEEQEEQLRFDDTEWLSEEELIGGGDISESLIYELISKPEDDDDRMPNEGDPLTREQIVLIRLWLTEGGKAEGWTPPEIIPGYEPAKPSRVTILAEGLPPAPEDALDALALKGALAMPLAQNNNLVRVDFERMETPAGDAELALLAPLSEHVTWLGLAGTGVTDAGLAAVAGLPKLTRLHLEHTGIGSAGLAHLSKLEHLEYLNLYDTQVGDDGLEHLKPLANLRKLFLLDSNATEEGARALEEAIPGLEVTLDIDFAPVVPEEEETEDDATEDEETEDEETEDEDSDSGEPARPDQDRNR